MIPATVYKAPSWIHATAQGFTYMLCQGKTGVGTSWSGIDRGLSKNKMMQLGNNRSREVRARVRACVCVCVWITGLWLICFVRIVRVEGGFWQHYCSWAVMAPALQLLWLGIQKHLRQLSHSDGFPVESVAKWLVNSSSSSSSTVDEFQLIKVLLKIVPYIRRLLGWINIPEFYFSKWMLLHGHRQNQCFFLSAFSEHVLELV